MRMIALTSAGEATMATAAEHLLARITARGIAAAVTVGISTAHEAQAVYAEHGEIWRIGDDSTRPELDALVDRAIDDSTPARMLSELDAALHRFCSKTQVAA